MQRNSFGFHFSVMGAFLVRCLSMIQGEDGVNTVVILCQSKEHAEGFRGDAEAWTRTLDEHGHQFEGQSVGEVVEHVRASA